MGLSVFDLGCMQMDSGNTEKQVIATKKQINKVERVIGSNDGKEMSW